jgi:hypothetical protein
MQACVTNGFVLLANTQQHIVLDQQGTPLFLDLYLAGKKKNKKQASYCFCIVRISLCAVRSDSEAQVKKFDTKS